MIQFKATSKIPSVMLIGLGSEIGSSLLLSNIPEKDGWAITHVLTRKPRVDKNYPELGPLHHLLARLAISDPSATGDLEIGNDGCSLVIKGRNVEIIWSDVETDNLSDIKYFFDVVILATSKRHLNTPSVISKIKKLGRVVYGVAENPTLPALYPAMQLGIPVRPVNSRLSKSEQINGVYCAGSCQTHGWLGQTLPLLDFGFKNFGMDPSDMLVRTEVDIIHPDTPTGSLGTHGFSARDQDARDNLRPSFSQLELAMTRLWPRAAGLNTVSLRTLTRPPGYQLCRTYLRVSKKSSEKAEWEGLAAHLRTFSNRYPLVLQTYEIPLGSRAFANTDSAAVVLLNKHHLRISDLSILLPDSPTHSLIQILTQAYVHNVRGYSAGISYVIKKLTQPGEELNVVDAQ